MEVLKPIIYYNLFNHPLRKDEIISFCHLDNRDEINQQIEVLLNKNIIQSKNGFYFIENGIDQVQKRIKGSQEAQKILPKALRNAKLIYQFPFVKGVAFSGSFSKDYFDEQSDIDFFIVTNQDRLWIARTLLILYKKIFLLNSRKYFCVNYFVSEHALEIEEKNRFTATELITLKVAYGHDVFHRFNSTNQWAFDYFLLTPPHLSKDHPAEKKPLFSKILENLLSNSTGNKLDDFFRKITVRRWLTKFKGMENEDFRIALKSKKNISKHHPQNFQKKIIDLFNKRCAEIENEFDVKLDKEYV